MDRIGSGTFGQGEDLVDVEIGLPGSGPVQQPGVVGEVDEIGVGIGAGVHGDGLDAEVVGGPDDAQSDLTAVGDEDSGDGGGRHSGAQHRGRCFGEDCGHGAPLYDHRTI